MRRNCCSTALPETHYNYKFENCLLKTKTNINTLNFVNCVANEDPMFRDKSVNDYRLLTGSAAIDKGNDAIIIQRCAEPVRRPERRHPPGEPAY